MTVMFWEISATHMLNAAIISSDPLEGRIRRFLLRLTLDYRAPMRDIMGANGEQFKRAKGNQSFRCFCRATGLNAPGVSAPARQSYNAEMGPPQNKRSGAGVVITLAIVLLLPIFYVPSTGPAVWLCAQGLLSRRVYHTYSMPSYFVERQCA